MDAFEALLSPKTLLGGRGGYKLRATKRGHLNGIFAPESENLTALINFYICEVSLASVADFRAYFFQRFQEDVVPLLMVMTHSKKFILINNHAPQFSRGY